MTEKTSPRQRVVEFLTLRRIVEPESHSWQPQAAVEILSVVDDVLRSSIDAGLAWYGPRYYRKDPRDLRRAFHSGLREVRRGGFSRLSVEIGAYDFLTPSPLCLRFGALIAPGQINLVFEFSATNWMSACPGETRDDPWKMTIHDVSKSSMSIVFFDADAFAEWFVTAAETELERAND